MVRIEWLKIAKNDLKVIYDFIANDSKRYAKKQIEEITKRTQILKKNPSAGKIVEEYGKSEVRELVEGNYRIIYKIIDSKLIHILMIHHSSRDLNKR